MKKSCCFLGCQLQPKQGSQSGLAKSEDKVRVSNQRANKQYQNVKVGCKEDRMMLVLIIQLAVKKIRKPMDLWTLCPQL